MFEVFYALFFTKDNNEENILPSININIIEYVTLENNNICIENKKGIFTHFDHIAFNEYQLLYLYKEFNFYDIESFCNVYFNIDLLLFCLIANRWNDKTKIISFLNMNEITKLYNLKKDGE